MLAEPFDLLKSLVQPEISHVLWQRDLPEHIDSVLERLTLLDDEARLEAAHAESSSLVPRIESRPAAAWIGRDIVRLARLMGELTGQRWIRARLAVIGDQRCPLFHSDSVVLRAVCTYLGAGTEWLSSDGLIHSARPGDVIFMKGESWPGGGPPCVHRSPLQPLGSSPRVVLRLTVRSPGRDVAL